MPDQNLDDAGDSDKLREVVRLLRERITQLNEAERLLGWIGPDARTKIERLLNEEEIDLSSELPGLTDGGTFLWFYRRVQGIPEFPADAIPFILLAPDQSPEQVAQQCQSKVPEIGVYHDTEIPRGLRLKWRQIVDWGLDLIDECERDNYAVLKDQAQVALAQIQREEAHQQSAESLKVVRRAAYANGEESFLGSMIDALLRRSDQADLHEDGPEEPAYFWFAGVQYAMEPTPCRLLRHLWSHPQQTREQVEEAVWGHDAKVGDRAVPVALSKINNLFFREKFPASVEQKNGYILLIREQPPPAETGEF